MASVKFVETVKPSRHSKIPPPRSGHRCCCDERNIYVFEGNSPHHKDELFQELWRFNVATKAWKLLPTTGSFPTEVASSCVILDIGNLVVFGGCGVPFGMCNSKKFHVCSLKTLQWFDLSDRYPRGQKTRVKMHLLLVMARAWFCPVTLSDKELYRFGGKKQD